MKFKTIKIRLSTHSPLENSLIAELEKYRNKPSVLKLAAFQFFNLVDSNQKEVKQQPIAENKAEEKISAETIDSFILNAFPDDFISNK